MPHPISSATAIDLDQQYGLTPLGEAVVAVIRLGRRLPDLPRAFRSAAIATLRHQLGDYADDPTYVAPMLADLSAGREA